MTFKDLCKDGGSYGIAASAVPYSPYLPTYLRITDINDDGTINMNGLKSVDDPNSRKYYLSPNDIVFARTGASTGRNYFYDGTDGEFVYAGFLIKFSIDPEKVNPKYIKYYCQSEEYNNWVRSYNTGSTRGNINAKTYGDMPIVLPARKQQDLLVDTLSSLDAKIAINNMINHHLEQMAQSIFKSWFVDFEPFADGEFIVSELGEIPAGWQVLPLGDVVDISTKTLNPNSFPDVLFEHYSIPAFDELRLPVFEMASEIKSNKYIVDKSCFLISKLNPRIKRIWRPYCISENAVCSTEFIVYSPKNPSQKDFYYSVIDSTSFTQFLLSHVTGSTGSRQRAIPRDTLFFPVAVPPDRVINDFCEIVTSIYEQYEQNYLENRLLRQTRDSLLPQLISGELPVHDLDT